MQYFLSFLSNLRPRNEYLEFRSKFNELKINLPFLNMHKLNVGPIGILAVFNWGMGYDKFITF